MDDRFTADEALKMSLETLINNAFRLIRGAASSTAGGLAKRSVIVYESGPLIELFEKTLRDELESRGFKTEFNSDKTTLIASW